MEEVCFQRNTKFFEDGVQPFSQLGLPYSPHSLAGYSGLFFFFLFFFTVDYSCWGGEDGTQSVRKVPETKVSLLLKGPPILKTC